MSYQTLWQKLNFLQPQSLTGRRAASVAFGMVVAVIVDRYFSTMQELWVPLSALLVMQVAIRTNLRLALQYFIVIILSVSIGSVVAQYVNDQFILNTLVVATFIMASYLHDRYAVGGQLLSAPLIVAMVVLIMLVPFPTKHVLYSRMHDVMLGGLIGLVSGLLVFPARADVDFRTGVMTILRAYEYYLLAITDLLFQQSEEAREKVQAKKIDVERVLQTQSAFFPEWVYEAGFNVALREGHRHFLVRTEQAGEILFALQHAARWQINLELLDKLHKPIAHSVAQTISIIDALVILLDLKKLKAPLPDFAEDMHALEALFHKTVALPLELLDISQDYVHLAAFIYDLKDLQKTLLKLAEALR
ncbi:MAG: hypothetical protein P4M14_13305 [Gammaproteobacteria bacterium]|nr:hypothetical protein [Gammaproteobacteria bacterium]